MMSNRKNRAVNIIAANGRACVGMLGLALTLPAFGDSFTTLELPARDVDIRTFSGGSAYNSLFPSSDQTLAGVPFHFEETIQGMNAYIGGAPLNLEVNIFGVQNVYTLISTAWGIAGTHAGSLTFLGSGALSYSLDLVVGANVRDHFMGTFVNTTTDPSTVHNVVGTATPETAHLDLQIISLPAAFASATLEQIVFQPVGEFPSGRAFLVAATVSVPETTGVPDGGSTFMLFGLGIGCVAAGRKLFVPSPQD